MDTLWLEYYHISYLKSVYIYALRQSVSIQKLIQAPYKPHDKIQVTSELCRWVLNTSSIFNRSY